MIASDTCAFPLLDRSGAASAYAGERSPIFERNGAFEIRLAMSERDLAQAQRLRYGVFYEHGRALASPHAAALQRDICPFDATCDHLLVVDTQARTRAGDVGERVVGTYRLLRREVADRHAGFYAQREFNVAPLLMRRPQTQFLELGRSCVHPAYRARRVIELLWRGLWLYSKHYPTDALMGCASLPGTDIAALEPQLSFLLSHARAEDDWLVEPLPHRAAHFTPRHVAELDARRIVLSLPPLVKAYLRAGARFGQGAVIDHQFGTTDVFAVMPMADIVDRYMVHYGGMADCVSGMRVA